MSHQVPELACYRRAHGSISSFLSLASSSSSSGTSNSSKIWPCRTASTTRSMLARSQQPQDYWKALLGRKAPSILQYRATPRRSDHLPHLAWASYPKPGDDSKELVECCCFRSYLSSCLLLLVDWAEAVKHLRVPLRGSHRDCTRLAGVISAITQVF